MRIMRWIGLFILLIPIGCASDRTDRRDDPLNALWRQGYGYNNSNRERIRNGCPPQNFDGTVDESD